MSVQSPLFYLAHNEQHRRCCYGRRKCSARRHLNLPSAGVHAFDINLLQLIRVGTRTCHHISFRHSVIRYPTYVFLATLKESAGKFYFNPV